MNSITSISSAMEVDFRRVLPEISIGKAMKMMEKKQVKYLAVIEDESFIGIVSYNDCEYFKSTLIKDGSLGPNEMLRLKHHKVREIMNTKLVKLAPSDSIEMALEIMKSIIFQFIPIVEGEKLLGVLTPERILHIKEHEEVEEKQNNSAASW